MNSGDYQRTGKLSHDNGKAWDELPKPRTWHLCRPQSWGTTNDGNRQTHIVELCRCGAIRQDGRRWKNRNSRTR